VHYVPRILSLAVAAQNPGVFDLATTAPEAAVTWEDVEVQRSLPLSSIAREAQVTEATLRELNPALLRSRTPPPSPATPFVLHVPQGRGAVVRTAIARIETPATRTYVLRHGETLDEVATRFGTRPTQVLSLSGLANDRGVGPGTMLLVPDRAPAAERAGAAPTVPFDAGLAAMTAPEGTQRVWLRLAAGDALAAVARALHVSPDDLARWNALDPNARLHGEMWLQAFVTRSPDDTARVYTDADVRLDDRASDAFHDRAVAAAGQVRLRVRAAASDTFARLAARYGTSPARLERINRRSQSDPLVPGETVVVYADPARAPR
jgi:LysM repeat protein